MTTATIATQATPPADVKGRLEDRVVGTAFARLPDEIIEQILHICDPNSFASLILLNSHWRRISQQVHLYAYHLSRCPSYSGSHPATTSLFTEDRLPSLRSSFAQEVKRNLFEAYLRPRETVINLVSTSISSSAALPGGEAFHFAFSPRGHHVLAYSTSRIYVINTAEKDLAIKRELKILRRPASVAILDDGSLLAVLSTDHQVDVYDLKGAPPKHIRAIALDNAPRTISLAPTGAVLAAAYEAGVEVYSLATTASATDRRSVKCDAADSLSFSQDGTQLLGTTLNSRNPSTVILTAPYYDPGDALPEQSISQLWTTSILFPHSSRDCSHAVLLPSPSDDEASWAFTYDRVFETFRAVRIDDLRNGTTYFTGPIPDVKSSTRLLPSTLPSATGAGELVAAGFQGKEIWLYGVPEDLDSSSNMSHGAADNVTNEVGSPTGSLARSNSAPSVRSHTWPRDYTSNRIPQWQALSDKSRNTFIEGRRISTLQGISAMKWVSGKFHASCSERLVIAAPGVVGQPSEAEDDGMAPVDGGRFCLMDFDYRTTNGEKCFVTIEVGDNEPEVLEEEHRDMETEIAIVRRRTVAQRGGRTHVLRSGTVIGRPLSTSSLVPPRLESISPLPPVPPVAAHRIARLETTQEQPDTVSIASVDDEQEALDAPYAHGAPRSRTTLRRAATAAAINRRLHPVRALAQEHIVFRRADGREEHPHESDADNWVPPPPPYTRDAVAPLPEHLRNAVLAGSVTTIPAANIHRSSTQRSSGSADSVLGSLQRSRSTFVTASSAADVSRHSSLPPQRSASDPTSVSTGGNSPELETVGYSRTADFDDLYDVSPPDTPEREIAMPAASAVSVSDIPSRPNLPHQIPRRPVSTSVHVIPVTHIAADASSVQPRSPIPQHTTANFARRADSTILEKWEEMVDPAARTSRPSSMASLTQTRLEASVPPRPNNDHRLSALPPSTPTLAPDGSPPKQQSPSVNQNRASYRRVETTSVAAAPELQHEGPPPDFTGPSASQLARLNSRSGRPSNRVLTDPSRRGSGSFPQPVFGSSSPRNSPVGGVPVAVPFSHVNPNQYPRPFAPPTIPVSSDSPTRSPNYPTGAYPLQHSQNRQGDYSPVRQMPSSYPNHRPRMQRLDTIHSATSQSDGPTFIRPGGMVRKASRAERSAALNIKQAKRSGWRGRRKEKMKDTDGASSAGWTDITRDTFGEDGGKKKGTRCTVM